MGIEFRRMFEVRGYDAEGRLAAKFVVVAVGRMDAQRIVSSYIGNRSMYRNIASLKAEFHGDSSVLVVV